MENNKIFKLFKESIQANNIPNEMYKNYNVKKGLRNENKTGVLVGLTRICDVIGYQMENGEKIDIPGSLYYRGIEITDFINNRSFKLGSYEELCFLLLFGKLPNTKEYQEFTTQLHNNYSLPEDFIQSNILRFPVSNLMNKIQRSILTLYSYDKDPDNASVENTLLQGLNILAKMPAIIVYAYFSKIHHYNNQALIINSINKNLTIAEEIFSLLKGENNYTEAEAELLDIMLCLHADHGGGNNSTFANLVISSTETDLYSSISGAIGSLKGPRHGGANERVKGMMNLAYSTLGLKATEEEVIAFIDKIINKEIYDKSGLLYGFGHAVYTLSDPRAIILADCIEKTAISSEIKDKFKFYQNFEKIATEYLYNAKGSTFCANVDFYSGLAYEMLGIPDDLILPLFATSRTVGWLAHNIENKLYCDRIIRPANKYIGDITNYLPIDKR